MTAGFWKMDGMSWRYMTLRYAWALGVYHALRSSRWSDEDKVMTLVVLGVLLCWKYPEGAFERAIAAGREIHGEFPIAPPRHRQRP